MYNEEVFNKFIALRFPRERDQGYIEEWRERFMGGEPENYMDSQSLAAYNMAKKLVF
jgi:hypothetical protein